MSPLPNKKQFHLGLVFGLLMTYLGLMHFLIGLRLDHGLLAALVGVLFMAHSKSRKFVIAVFPLLLFWIIYDTLRVFPNYLYNTVHIAEPYEIEKYFFGIPTPQGFITLNEYFAEHYCSTLDIVSGFVYLCWIPLPLAVMIYFWFTDKLTFLRFAYVFALTNFIGFVIYYLYPVAPPWYVTDYGFVLDYNVGGSPAALSRFDDYFGIGLFHSMYGMNANVFAAIPSLHCAFPIIPLYFSVQKRMYKLLPTMILFWLAMWFSAVYLQHHYLIDAILGGGCTLLAIIILDVVLMRVSFGKWLEDFAKSL